MYIITTLQVSCVSTIYKHWRYTFRLLGSQQGGCIGEHFTEITTCKKVSQTFYHSIISFIRSTFFRISKFLKLFINLSSHQLVNLGFLLGRWPFRSQPLLTSSTSCCHKAVTGRQPFSFYEIALHVLCWIVEVFR